MYKCNIIRIQAIIKVLLSIFIFIGCNRLFAQCVPPASDSCHKANVLCSLDAVNGYSCKNTDVDNSTGCKPLCPSGGSGENTSWWAFVGKAGMVCIEIEFSNCSVTGNGVQMGIYGDCTCSLPVVCNSACNGPGKYQLCGTLEACKTYYLFVDGCTGDVCDFTLRTNGGGPPQLNPLKELQGPTDLCGGSCDVVYKVIQDSSTCIPVYNWTLDSVKNDTFHGNQLTLDFPVEGDYVLCVSAVIGNSIASSICDMVGPICVTIHVTKEPIRKAGPRFICAEDLPYKWFNITVDTSGTYTQRFTANCCDFDSAIDFVALAPPLKPDFYMLSCKGQTYVDPITNISFANCENGTDVILKNSTTPNFCDSSYRLFLTYLNFGSKLVEYCSSGKIFLEAQVVDSTCPINTYSTLGFDYLWYLKGDPIKNSLGATNFIEVQNKADYCVDITIRGQLDNQNKQCTFTFCELQNEDDFKQKMVCPKGDLDVCKGASAFYSSDTIFPINVKHIWLVTNGRILTPNPSTQSTIEVIWDYDPGFGIPYVGKICYHYESDCPPSPECCIEINVQPSPNPNAGLDKSICGLSNTIDGVFDIGGSKWIQISGPPATITPNTSETPTVVASAYGRAGFSISETRFGCTTIDTVYLNFNETPDKGVSNYVCEPDQKSYTICFKITGGNKPYKIIKGNGTIDLNDNYCSGLIPNLVKDTIVIEDINGCTFTFIQSHECLCSNEIGQVSNAIQKVCEDDFINIVYNKQNEKLDQAPNRDTVMFFVYSNVSNPQGSFIKFINGNNFNRDPLFNFGQTYYIGAILGRSNGNGGVDSSKGCLKESYGTPFIFYEIPKPFAGRDTSICGSTFSLSGLQSVVGSTITWREKSNKPVSFSNPNSTATNVAAMNGYGTYIFVINENNNGICTTEDEVSITFNPNPDLINVDKFCVEPGSSPTNPGKYKVTIDINNGTPPFTLDIPPSTANGKIIGSQYMTDSVPSLINFTVRVKDINGCVSSIITDTYNCNCGPIDAGRLDTGLTRVCQDQCVNIKSLITETIDPTQEIAMYVLHNSYYLDTLNTLDTFYSINDIICFDPKKMKLGDQNPYYITRVVGDDVLPKNGIVDFNDYCRRASNDMKIVWEPYPSPNAGTDIQVCGLNYNLNGVLSFGNASWKQLTGPGNSNIANQNALMTSVIVSIKGVYTYELTGDNFNCIRRDTIRVTYVDDPQFIDNNLSFVCDSVAENYKIRIDLQNGDKPSWKIIGTACNGTKVINGVLLGNSNTWLSDWIPNGCDFILILNDVNDCNKDSLIGNHTCPCLTDAANLDLTPINLCSDGTAQAKYTIAPGILDPNDVVRYVLYDGNPNQARNGVILQVNNNGTFKFQAPMVLGKTYYIAVFVGNLDASTGNVNLNDRCFDNTPGVPVTWYQYPVANIAGVTMLTCAITSIDLDASGSISGSGSPLKYLWNTSDTSSKIKITLPGNYIVTVTDPIAGCTHTANIQIVRLVDLPKVIIDTPLKFTCKLFNVNIDGNRSDKGAPYVSSWTGPGIVSGNNSNLVTVNVPGVYRLLIVNSITNCRDSAFVTIGEDKKIPNAKIAQTGRLGCVIKQIKLDGLQSTGSSGLISTYTWIGNVISGQNTSTITIGSPGGSFILEVRDSTNGCIDRDTILVGEDDNPLSEIRTSLQNPLCNGQRNGEIVVDEVLDKNGMVLQGLMYSLNGGAFVSNNKFSNLSKGNYTVTVRDANGCILAKNNVLVEPIPLEIKVIKSIVVDIGSIVNLDTFLLSLSGGTTNQFGEYRDTTWLRLKDSTYLVNLSHQADTSEDFVITGIDETGCTVYEIVRIIVRVFKDVWWPTVINPNSTLSENGRFNIYGKRVRNIKLLNIYSRWGELVYSAHNIQDANKMKGLGWDGVFRGQKALPGVYTFYCELEYENSTGVDKIKGDFTLIR
ncbi:MAG: hypothetical protein ABI851_02990 [Saprospiraceae bacterium]